MIYNEALAWLYSTQQFGIKLGLENTRRLLEELGGPEHDLRILHVAGTNGKGSVCAMLDAALRRAGFRTGLYTSPHLRDFRERIRVDGEMIPKAAVAAGLTRIRTLAAGWNHSPTFFEICTVLALRHFSDSACEFVVLETGMGGRLDATNAVHPLVSILTPIDYDHMEWLGDTLGRIAAEKAGIIKPGVPAVSSPQTDEAADVFRERAAAVGAPFSFVTKPWTGPIGLAGSHQKWNAALAVAALRAAEIDIPGETVAAALAAVEWPGRFQRLSKLVIVDGAHNPHAIERLCATWREEFGGARPLVIFGALQDKDAVGMLAHLDRIADEYLFVPVQSARAADPRHFSPLTKRSSRVADSLQFAIESLRGSERPVLITGSLFLAGEVLDLFEAR